MLQAESGESGQIIDFDDEDEGETPFDEREQFQVHDNPAGKKKLPFSFLMHNYLKTNAGKKQQLQPNIMNVSFSK